MDSVRAVADAGGNRYRVTFSEGRSVVGQVATLTLDP